MTGWYSQGTVGSTSRALCPALSRQALKDHLPQAHLDGLERRGWGGKRKEGRECGGQETG